MRQFEKANLLNRHKNLIINFFLEREYIKKRFVCQ